MLFSSRTLHVQNSDNTNNGICPKKGDRDISIPHDICRSLWTAVKRLYFLIWFEYTLRILSGQLTPIIIFHTISFMVEEVEVVQSRNANNFCALPVTWAGCLLCGWVGTRQGPLGRRLLPTDKCEQVVLRTTLCHSLKAPCALRTRA